VAGPWGQTARSAPCACDLSPPTSDDAQSDQHRSTSRIDHTLMAPRAVGPNVLIPSDRNNALWVLRIVNRMV
jgi:hypothetical protein